MVKNKTIRCLAILHEIEKYLTGAEYNKAAIYSHLAGNGATAALEAKLCSLY